MGKDVLVVCFAVMMGMGGTEIETESRWRRSVEERSPAWGELKGREIWRKELGEERSLLLYIEETGERRICFTDGPWVYMTEELVERVKAAGLQFWLEQQGGRMTERTGRKRARKE